MPFDKNRRDCKVYNKERRHLYAIVYTLLKGLKKKCCVSCPSKGIFHWLLTPFLNRAEADGKQGGLRRLPPQSAAKKEDEALEGTKL